MLVGLVGTALFLVLLTTALLLYRGNFAIVTGASSIVVSGIDWMLIASAALLIVFTWLIRAVPRATSANNVGPGVISFFAFAAIAAGLLALGPEITVKDRAIGTGPFNLLYQYVPGFNGLRAPARFIMVVEFCLAILAGAGAAVMLARRRLAGTVLVCAACTGILIENWFAPMQTHFRMDTAGLNPTGINLVTGSRISPLYTLVRDSTAHPVLIEFPFGEPGYEIQASFYAGYHRRPIINGYSGFFPDDYMKRATFLVGFPKDLDAATKAVRHSMATMALVHEDAFLNGRGHEITEWLMSMGARQIAADGNNKLLQLPPPPQ
jgi:hypothetical protein